MDLRGICPLGRKQVILSGIETRVCVLQTAADVIQRGYGVHEVADAVRSRRRWDWKIGLRWMERKRRWSPTEIIAFELLKEDRSRRIQTFVENRQVKRGNLRLEQPRYKRQEEIRVREDQRPGHNSCQVEFHFLCLFHFFHL
jgi:hypothetical protein